MRLYDLPRDELLVRAAPEICLEVISSAGHTLERLSDGSRLVEFESALGRKRIRTKELVRIHESGRIDYRWIEGPLPAVEETITLEQADGGTTLRYEGRFGVRVPRLIRPLARRYIAKRFARAVHAHLLQAKEIAEGRAHRSHLYPQPRDGNDPTEATG